MFKNEALIIRTLKEKDKITKLCQEIKFNYMGSISEMNYLCERLVIMKNIIEGTILQLEDNIEESKDAHNWDGIPFCDETDPAICEECAKALEEDARECRETIGDD